MDDDEKIILSKDARAHLRSLRDGPKTFHIGRCPVQSIAIGWQLVADGLAVIVTAEEEGKFDLIHITDKGRAWLKRHEKK